MMKKQRPGARIAMIAAIGMTAAMALAGCSGSPSAAPTSGKTTLTVLSWKGIKGQEANVPEINAAFEKSHPDITLKFETLASGTSYTQKLQTELLGGNGPDVMMVDGGSFPQFASAGYFSDLSGQSWAKYVSGGIRQFNTAGGKLESMPMEATGVGLYSNLAVLKKAGITHVPTDWPTFLADLTKVKDTGATPISIPDKEGWGGTLSFLNIGATVVPRSWDDRFYTGKTDFSAWSPVVAKLKQLDTSGALSWQNELGIDEFSQGLGDFENGNTAFWMQGAWNLADIQSKKLDVNFTAFPGGDAGSKPSDLVFAGTSWAINKASKHQAAADEYLAYWAKPTVLVKYLQSEAAISPFTNGSSPANAATAPFVASYKAGRYRYMQTATWFSGNAQTDIGSALQGYFLGQTSESAALAALEKAGVRKK